MHRVVTYTEKMTVQLWGVTSGIGEFFVIQSFAFYFARSFFRQVEKYGLSTIFHQNYLNVKTKREESVARLKIDR